LETYHENYEQATIHIAKAQSEVYDELQARTAYLDFSANNYASAITTLAKSQVSFELQTSSICPEYHGYLNSDASGVGGSHPL
jgi:hypothetical protein